MEPSVRGGSPSVTTPYITDKQKAFVDEYCVDFNAARAGRKQDIHYKTIKLWMQHPGVLRYIDVVLEQRRQANEELVKLTLEELKTVMLSDIKDYVEWAGNIITLKNSVDIACTKAVKGIENTRNGVKIILHDKVRSIELMMQGLGMIRKARPTDDDDKKIPQDAETTPQSLLEALTKAHEERLALPKLTGGMVEIDQSQVKQDD